jgi:uncharacterized membrane protein YtjA (UPF0391 family)
LDKHLLPHSAEGGAGMERDRNMMRYALVFISIAILAAVLGLSGVAVASALTAKLLFFVFLAIFICTLAVSVARGV